MLFSVGGTLPQGQGRGGATLGTVSSSLVAWPAQRIAGVVVALVVAFSADVARADTSAAPGPCEQPGALGSIVDRPGQGRATPNSGSPCVVPASHVVVELGYRNQTTRSAAGTSTLEIFPLPLVRVGLGKRIELVLQPPSHSVRSSATLGGTFVPAVGEQDLGLGFKIMLRDRSKFQDAIGILYTAPTGSPQGSTGFSAGGSTYALTYTSAFALGNLGLSITQVATANAAPLDPAGAAHFFSYQVAPTLSYGFAPGFTVIGSDQVTSPLGPSGGTGNRAIFAVQRVLSPGAVVDFDYEANLLPAAPASRQHVFGAGVAFEI